MSSIISNDQLNKTAVAVNEITDSLQIQVSKLQSQRLHLQGLIAKRDRLDYEIKTLKQVIRKTKKASALRGKPLKEEAICLLESAETGTDLTVPADVYERYSERVLTELQKLKFEEELVDIIMQLPRLDDR